VRMMVDSDLALVRHEATRRGVPAS
jgi:hypothetical protein